eukprot:XP_003728232.1 PREDICTED: uncharacterized protein LOC100889074 isoform X2 [Strongylocentrotus purpuratus]
MVGCQVKGCPNRSSRVLKKSMFSIPNPQKERDRCEKWLSILGSQKFKIETYECVRSRVVCEDHFKPECFEEDIRAKIMGYEPRKRLRPDAVPTIPFVAGKRHSSETRSSPKRKKQKVVTSRKSKNGACSKDIKEETSFEGFSIPPLFPSRIPLNDEEEEDEDEPNPDLDDSDEDSPAHPADVMLSMESTSQCSTLQDQEYDVGPYCREAGISAADITSGFQNVSPMPTIKNGLVLEIYDYLHETQMYDFNVLIKNLKRLNNSPEVGNWSVGAYIKRLVERKVRAETDTENGEKDLGYLREEEFMLSRKKTFTKKYVSPRTKSLHKHLELAKQQREETWKCLDKLEKDMQHLKQEKTSLSEKVTELTFENKDLRETVGSLLGQCHELEQFKKKYRDLKEKCHCQQFPEIDMKNIEERGEKST